MILIFFWTLLSPSDGGGEKVEQIPIRQNPIEGFLLSVYRYDSQVFEGKPDLDSQIVDRSPPREKGFVTGDLVPLLFKRRHQFDIYHHGK